MSDTTPSTPGFQAIVNFKSRDQAMVEFKKPIVGKKKLKQKILTEEKYIEELSKIIQRDFFPDLDRLRAQNDFLDALDRKDYVQMEAIRAKYSGRQPTERSRSLTPATFETPASASYCTPRHGGAVAPNYTPASTSSNTSRATSTEGGRKTLSDNHSLDSFLQSYTSEDNYSFQEIIDTADKKLRQKFSVLYNEEELSADKLARALTLPTIEQQFEEPDPLRKIETWTYKNMNSIMYIPDGVPLTEKERIESADRKQIIKHSATRMASSPFDDTHNQKTISDKSKSQALTDKVGVDGMNTNAAPQIRGFDMVKTPSPRPGEAFSPLMTWGEIEGTPFRLDGSMDTPVRSNSGPSFKINESSRRENIGLALAEKVGEKMRAQKQRAMDTARKNIGSPFIRSNMERLASMSPAARHLATTLGTPLLTPSPLHTSGFLSGKGKSGLGKPTHPVPVSRKTPSNAIASLPTTPKQISSGKSTLTDDLLKIPTKRLKASDFF